MFNHLTITAGKHERYGDHPDCLIVLEWVITVEGQGRFYVKNENMVFYECVDESGEVIVSSDSLDGIITHLLEYQQPVKP